MTFAWWSHTRRASVASYRLRCLQVIAALRTRGIGAGLYQKGRAPSVLVLSKRYDPPSLEHAQQLRVRHGTRLVLDLCDNHFYSQSDDALWVARAESLRQAVRAVDMVVCGSSYLEAVVRKEAGQAVLTTVIGDAAEPPFTPSRLQGWRHPVAEVQLRGLQAHLHSLPVVRERRLVWFGNHGSAYAEGGMNDLERIQSALLRAHQDGPISLTIISNNAAKYKSLTRSWTFPHHYLGWHLTTFSRALMQHSVALIPVEHNPFTLCKTSNRVITSSLHGLAVAADSLPSYQEFDGCVVLDDWDAGFRELLSDQQRQEKNTALARQKIQGHWTLEQIADQWLAALNSTAQHN